MMGLKARMTGGDGGTYSPPPQGRYLGVVVGVYDVGTQPGYEGGPSRPCVVLEFELFKRIKGGGFVNALTEGGTPHTVRTPPLSLSFNERATLVKYVLALTGLQPETLAAAADEAGGYDVENLVGTACEITLAHKITRTGRTTATITGTIAIDSEADEIPATISKQVYWDRSLGTEVPKAAKYWWSLSKEGQREARQAREGSDAPPEDVIPDRGEFGARRRPMPDDDDFDNRF